ncbi:MAG: pseudouridine-5'-phosphate glycosidase, partial [Actinomycetota bacterium]
MLVSTEVRQALAQGGPVVALESTIFSHLGLPSPASAEALEACSSAIRELGAVPAAPAAPHRHIKIALDASETHPTPYPAHTATKR